MGCRIKCMYNARALEVISDGGVYKLGSNMSMNNNCLPP